MKTRILSVWLGLVVASVSAQETPREKPAGADDGQPAGRKTMTLTLRECVESALRNNLDVTIERITPKLADASVLGEHAAFEPALSLGASFLSSTTPLSARARAAALGLPSVSSEQIQTSLSLGGKLPMGLLYRLDANDTGAGNTFNRFETEYSAFTGLSLTQPLLKNGWWDTNLTGLRVARKSRQLARETLIQRLMATVTAAQKAYFDMVFVIEDLRTRRESLALAEALLAENRARLRAGVMSPLDVTEAEAAVAGRREDVLVGERAVLDQENVMKRLISSDVFSLRDTSIMPVDKPSLADVTVDVSESLRAALSKRPDYLQARLETERRSLLLQFARNQLYPQIDLQATYGLNGLNNDFASSFGKAFEGDNPQWSVGLAITVPLGNQKARADHATARLESERSLLNLKRVEQTVIVEVDNAAGQVQTNFRRIDAAREARRLAEEKLAAEKKKLDAGTSTSFFVLQFQQDLARARTNELRAILDYNKSLRDLYNAEGTVLERAGVHLNDQ